MVEWTDTGLEPRFNGKIKYIRDFFITLFFAALGMQVHGLESKNDVLR